jgi:glycosyltransferase involved in cell wall biosynthesis
MKISLLMSVYHGEKSEYFDLAMHSIWTNQTLKPDQIVMVIDGNLTRDLYSVLDDWKATLGSILTIVQLQSNIGLGSALEIGLKHCNFELIARMDTDDISNSCRFKLQHDFLETHTQVDVVGTFISEINEKGDLIRDVIKYPLSHNEMKRFFSKRDPLPHVTVMFRQNFFKKTGGYSGELRMAEDTLLWHKGFLSGCKFANIPYVGVSVRLTNDFYKRRGDMSKAIGLLRYRLLIINRKHNYGIISDVYAILYFLMSISPGFAKKIAYRLFR